MIFRRALTHPLEEFRYKAVPYTVYEARPFQNSVTVVSEKQLESNLFQQQFEKNMVQAALNNRVRQDFENFRFLRRPGYDSPQEKQ